MSIFGSKSSKAISVTSSATIRGANKDKHCFGTTTKGKQCNGKRIGGKNFGRHRTDEHGGKQPEKVEDCNQDHPEDGCRHC
jgi:hypothetical protein